MEFVLGGVMRWNSHLIGNQQGEASGVSGLRNVLLVFCWEYPARFLDIAYLHSVVLRCEAVHRTPPLRILWL